MRASITQVRLLVAAVLAACDRHPAAAPQAAGVEVITHVTPIRFRADAGAEVGMRFTNRTTGDVVIGIPDCGYFFVVLDSGGKQAGPYDGVRECCEETELDGFTCTSGQVVAVLSPGQEYRYARRWSARTLQGVLSGEPLHLQPGSYRIQFRYWSPAHDDFVQAPSQNITVLP